MTLYHFCAAHMLESIKQQGLTLGHTPIFINDREAFIGGTQWLTAESSADKQSWATSILIPYRRTAYRLTIIIPGGHMYKLFRAADFIKRLPDGDESLIAGWDGSDQWYVYKGKVPAKWIIEIIRTEG